MPSTSSVDPRQKAVHEGRLVLMGPFQLEAEGRTFNSLLDRTLGQIAFDRGLRSAEFVRWRRVVGP